MVRLFVFNTYKSKRVDPQFSYYLFICFGEHFKNQILF
ncbi:CRPV-237 [Crowpox virus]|nr:CRPV-237 [Crowpox virus]